MFALRNIVQLAPRVGRVAGQERGVISGPPKVRIPFPEKVVHGIIIAIGSSAIPIWVVNHITEYKGAPEPEE